MRNSTTTWQTAIELDRLRPGRCKIVKVGDEDVLVARVDDEVHATQGLCSHVRTPLGPGRLTPDGMVECPMHGALFSPADGAVHKGPAKIDLVTYPTRVVDGMVEVQLANDDGNS